MAGLAAVTNLRTQALDLHQPLHAVAAAGLARFAQVEICRKMGIAEATFYVWRKKYGGLGPSELKRLRVLEDENRKLKQLVADLSLDKAMLQEVVTKKL